MPSFGDVVRDGERLHYWRWPGGDPPGLLLHGIGNYGRYWDFLAREIGGRLRLVAPDARGHGESGKPAQGYSPDEFVADALAILDALGIARVIAVGHSMGGGHAARLAATHPDRAAGLVLVDWGLRADAPGSSRARRLSLERPSRFADLDEALTYLRETSPGYSDAVYANRLRWLFRKEGGELVWRSSRESLAAILATSVAEADRRAWLRTIRCPTLVVRGTRSPVLSDQTARATAASIARAQLVELDAAHNVALDRPRELAQLVVDFATDIVTRAE